MEGDAVVGPWGCGRVVGEGEDRVKGRNFGDGQENRAGGKVRRDHGDFVCEFRVAEETGQGLGG